MTGKVFRGVRRWREGAGFSQAMLAECLGVSVRTISGLESGRLSNGNPVDWRTLRRYRLMVKGLLSKAADPF